MADCVYQGQKYQHGEPVVTSEPCLNCTCKRGVLLCFLKVCPMLMTQPLEPNCQTVREPGQCCPSVKCPAPGSESVTVTNFPTAQTSSSPPASPTPAFSTTTGQSSPSPASSTTAADAPTNEDDLHATSTTVRSVSGPVIPPYGESLSVNLYVNNPIQGPVYNPNEDVAFNDVLSSNSAVSRHQPSFSSSTLSTTSPQPLSVSSAFPTPSSSSSSSPSGNHPHEDPSISHSISQRLDLSSFHFLIYHRADQPGFPSNALSSEFPSVSSKVALIADRENGWWAHESENSLNSHSVILSVQKPLAVAIDFMDAGRETLTQLLSSSAVRCWQI